MDKENLKIKLDNACNNLRKAIEKNPSGYGFYKDYSKEWKELYKMGSVQTRKAREIQNGRVTTPSKKENYR